MEAEAPAPSGRRFRLSGSVRLRITLLATLVVGATLGLAAVVLVSLQREALTDNLDAVIVTRVANVEDLLRRGQPPSELSAGDEELLFIQVVDASQTVISSSPNVRGLPPIVDLRASPAPFFHELPGPAIKGAPFRVLARSADGSPGTVTILVGGSLDDVNESASILTRLLVTGIPIVLAVVALGSWLLVGRALAPVEAIRAEVGRIGDGDLDRRVPEPRTADEIGRLARTMNAMLGRLQRAHERQAAFVADAAHELRSPLASLKTQLEVDLPASTPPLVARSLAEEVDRMSRLIDDLLYLASREGTLTPAQATVDLDDIVLAEVRKLRRPEGLQLDALGVSAAAVRGDGEQLARAIRNLLENAARHARSRVVVELREAMGLVTLAVTDDGPGIPPGSEEAIFERFTRLDASRAREGGGAGLGLAIVRATVGAHGGGVSVDSRHVGGARFVVTLPALTSGQSAL